MGSKRHVSVLLGMMFLVSTMLAQTEGTVSGTVTDPSAAQVIAAAVTALNLGTGVTTSTVTNSSGVYVFASLPPGQYKVTAEHPGFRRAAVNDADLAVGSQITVNFALDLGQTTESVEVRAAATEVSVSTAAAGSVVEPRRSLELPPAGRSAHAPL